MTSVMGYFTTAVIITFLHAIDAGRMPRKSHEVECPMPGKSTKFIPVNGEYCAYGISYTADEYGGDIIVNRKEDKRHVEFEAATISLCKGKQLNKPQFGGGWITNSNGTMNIFFACCRKCAEFNDTKEVIHLNLKNKFTAYSFLNVKKLYGTIRSAESKRDVMYRQRYYVQGDDGNAVDLSICLTEGYRVAPSPVNTPVCFAKVIWHNHCETCGDPPDREYLNIRSSRRHRLIHQFGPYDAISSGKMRHLRCGNEGSADRCMYWDNYRGFNVECCCYGSETQRMVCQTNVTRGGRQVDNARGNCAVRTFTIGHGNETYATVHTSLSNASNADRDTVSGEVLLKDYYPVLENTEFCVTHLFQLPRSSSGSIIYSHERVLLHQFDLVPAEDVAPSPWCRDLAIDDHRLRDIYVKECYVGLPLNRMCPFRYVDDDVEYNVSSILCCCNDESYCNHEGDLRARTLYDPLILCQYNNDYQQLFNKYAVNDSLKHHSCLVHYAHPFVSGFTASTASSAGISGLLNVLPGAPLLPIDYSYTFLNETNACGFIEANVHHKYMATRQCGDDELLDSEFLPLKLFVCRCKTAVIGGKPSEPCDIQLRKNISDIENEYVRTHRDSVCLQYHDEESQKDALDNMLVIYNRASGACKMSVKLSEKGYKISASLAKTADVDKARVPLNHASYAMFVRSADETTVCSSNNGSSVCFCRSYTDGVACNQNVIIMKTALRQAYLSTLLKMRHNHVISLSLNRTTDDASTCRERGSVAVISRNKRTSRVQLTAECLYQRDRKEMPGIVCRRKITQANKCVIKRGRVVCCCVKADCCERLEQQVVKIMNTAAED